MAGADTQTSWEAIIRRYAEVLDRLRPGPAEVFDESALRDSRSAIIEALAKAASDVERSPFSPAEIQGWLAGLAQFQPGVGMPILDPASEMARRMTAARRGGEKVDAAAIARAVEEQSEREEWRVRHVKVAAAVERDQKDLLGLLVPR